MVKSRLSFAFALPVALFGIALVVGVGCGDSTPSTPDGGGGKAGGSGGKGGSAAGTSGGGTGGSAAGTGGGGTGGGGTGGSAAGTSGGGTGGSTAGTGGSAAGAGGGGRGGNTAGAGGGAGHVADAGSDAATDARDAGPTCTNVCTAGNHRCAGGGSETCVVGSNGCTQWGTATICAGVTTCAAGSGLCACPAAPSGCTAAGTFCSGSTNVITCHQDAQGCFSVSAPVACPTDTTCKGALPNAACTCDNDANCSGANSFCMNPSTVATCGADSNTPACNVVKSTTACLGSSFCSGGACVCPAIGTAAGTGCATLAATSCSGDDILTCVTETASGCSIWQASTHCGDTGFTCGTQGGVPPACQCPPRTTPDADVYVDPVAGSDVMAGVGNVFPTGIQTPAACRYASLTNGLTKIPVQHAGRVIAISAVTPVTFAGETFPLTIPTGVSVLTADAVFTPGNYVINFNAGTTAVKMSNSSALRGFTVLNGAAVSQALVSCTAGSAILDTVDLEGAAKAVDGIDVLGTCAASLNAVQIENLSGVALNVSSSGVTSVTGGALSTSLIGLQQTAGTVGVTGLSVTGNGQYGIILPTASTGTPNLTLGAGTVVSGNGVTGTFSGVDIGKGSLSATSTVITSNGGIGLQLTSAGGTYQLTTVNASSNGVNAASFGVGMTAGTLTASGLTASSNTDSGVSVSAGNANLTGATVTQNTNRGLTMSGGTVTISGGTFKSNGLAGVFGLAGTLTVQGGTELASNGTHGVHLTGAVTVVAGANIHNNTLNGVLVNDTAGVTVNIGSAATVTSINANGNDGILVQGAPATGGGANSLTIDTVGIGTNGKFGIYLQGNTAATAATIKASTITANGDVGIMLEQAGANITTEAIQNNDVNGNNTANVHTVGGILFNTSSTLTSFIGNKVHSNGGDELGFNALPNGALRWVINPPSAACDATANSLYCYGNGNVGLHILAGAETVDGQHVHWANNPPTSGIDFSGTVTVTNPCTAVATCP